MVQVNGTKAKTQKYTEKNPLETIADFGTSTVKNTANELGKIGGGMLDQFFGGNDDHDENNFGSEFNLKAEVEKARVKAGKQEVKVFNYQEYYENTLIKKQIAELTEAIKREIDMLKKADSSLMNDVRDVENITINSLPDRVGVYHVRFLELVLNIMRTLRAKVGESRTWLSTLKSKKAKRGSAFAARSKKSGTQYSMSQELSNSRSVQ